MRSILVCFDGLLSGFWAILIGIEMTGKVAFPVKWTFPSEMDACWISGEPDNNNLQDWPGRAFGGSATDMSL